MVEIAILLSTYNSEKYLGELLDSILAQQNRKWRLFIRDDGSRDNTIAVIHLYQNKNPNIVFLDDNRRGLGPRDSFMWLLSSIEANHYMFCDHDDVWLEGKIAKTYSKMLALQDTYKGVPIIVHTDLIVVDENLNEIAASFWKYSRKNPLFNSFMFYCAYNNVTGCTMMINREAKALSFDMPAAASMHDSWLALVVSFHKGIIAHVNEPLILYRQHSNNVIGAERTPNFIKKIANLRVVIRENHQLFKAVNHLRKFSVLSFILNKIRFKILLIFSRY